jgi:hypothetical protein
MKRWRKSDIGKIIVYKSKSELGELKNEKIVIYDVNSKVPNTVGFVEYPITLNSEVYPRILTSKIGLVGIYKNQKKKSEEYLENEGDWCFIDKVSKDEMGELERIAKAPKTQLYEDLSPRYTFQ